MRKEYLVKVQFASDAKDNKWFNAAALDPTTKVGQRVFASIDDAKRSLDYCLQKFNKVHAYDKDGYRIETFPIGGGFAADMKSNKSVDDMCRIVKWSIQEREVTEWEIVDRYDKRIAETSSCQV